MPGKSTVGVHDDLSTGQSSITDRAANDEPAGRIDIQVARELSLVVEAGGQHRKHYLVPQIIPYLLSTDLISMLGRDQNLLHRDRHIVPIAHGDLGFAVGPKIGQSAILAHPRKPRGQSVRQRDRHRHQLRGLIRGIPEHHPLIARSGTTGFVFGELPAPLMRQIHTLSDISDCLSNVVITAQLCPSKP